jgi:hypothetical protein
MSAFSLLFPDFSARVRGLSVIRYLPETLRVSLRAGP